MRGPVLPSLWLVLGLALGAAGCNGPNCQASCVRVYDPNECETIVAGVSSEALIRDCVDECEGALTQIGPMGGYSPYARPPVAFTLQNEVQAAAWMDCVDAASCEDLSRETTCWR